MPRLMIRLRTFALSRASRPSHALCIEPLPVLRSMAVMYHELRRCVLCARVLNIILRAVCAFAVGFPGVVGVACPVSSSLQSTGRPVTEFTDEAISQKAEALMTLCCAQFVGLCQHFGQMSILFVGCFGCCPQCCGVLRSGEVTSLCTPLGGI